MSDVQEIITALNEARIIAIAGHTNPDGDAIGSCFSLAAALYEMGKEPQVLLEDYNEKFNVIPGGQFVFHGDAETLKPDLFVALDCGSAARLGRFRTMLERTPKSVCIDHHINSERFATFHWQDEKASSTAQMVFDIVNQLVAIDVNVASALYAGIVFDTGGFRHANTSPKTHAIAGRLMNMGIPFGQIYNEILYSHSLTEAKIFLKALGRLVVDAAYPIATLYVTAADMTETGATKQDLDGIVEYARNTRGVLVSVFAYEAEAGEVKISMRSHGVAVNEAAQKFGGGGHRQAAGCVFTGTVQEAFDAILPHVRQAVDASGAGSGLK